MDHTFAESSTRRELENHLINRALRDDQFRELLIANPRKAVEAEIQRLQLSIAIPPNLKIKVLEESTDTLYLVLPPSLIGDIPPEDDFFLETIRALSPGNSSNEPNDRS